MFDQFIGFQARQRPNSPAAIMEGRTISFAVFDADIGKVAHALRGLTVEPGEAVAIAITDLYHRWLTILALARLGIASAPSQDPPSHKRIADRPEGGPRVVEATSAWFTDVLRTPVPKTLGTVRPPRDELARVVRTSGTTGDAKRIGLSWGTLDAIIRNVPLSSGASRDGRWLPFTGPSTVLGFALAIGAWATGNTVILHEATTLSADVISRYAPTLMGITPYQLQELLGSLPPGARPQHGLRIVTAGSVLPLPLVRRARAILTEDLLSIYGASECSSVAIADPGTLEAHPNAAGYVLPGVAVEIVDEAGCPVPDGGTGEVRIRSDRVADGYLDDAAQTAARFREGWFCSGDIGRMLEGGLLTIEGRLDDMMNLGGDKVPPDLVERAVVDLSGVRDVAAFSVPDDTGLERCWLAIVPDMGFAADRLEQRLRERLPWLGRLTWVTVDEVPRNPMGKIQRDRLRAAVQLQRGSSRSGSL